MEKLPNIVFMGTAMFAIPSLEILISHGYQVSGVVTSPDKPAGRGRHLQISPVKEYGLEKNLNILQPDNLKGEDFVAQLKLLNPDLMVVVAFRMLPAAVWQIPPLGTINLHASLLPQYRGAAPINHAIINGEMETGLTTFFINDKIDTGNILFQQKVEISDQDDAGSLHDKMKLKGAELLLKTVQAINSGQYRAISQELISIEGSELKPAPKIFKEDCLIRWDKTSGEINNLIRGLSPYPGAVATIKTTGGDAVSLKIFKAEKEIFAQPTELPGKILTDHRSFMKVCCKDGYLKIAELQQEGKRRMSIEEFLRGFRLESDLMQW